MYHIVILNLSSLIFRDTKQSTVYYRYDIYFLNGCEFGIKLERRFSGGVLFAATLQRTNISIKNLNAFMKSMEIVFGFLALIANLKRRGGQ
jgi:hypothetical protein